MAENPIVIIGGVRYRRDDAKRLGITVKTPEPPATLAAAEVASKEADQPEAVKGADSADNVSGDAAAVVDADGPAGGQPAAAPRARAGKR